jgi:osmoprotectant transport system substrate-binding protein
VKLDLRAALAALLVALLAGVAGACGSGDGGEASGPSPAPAGKDAPIRIGTKNFTEQYILGELYRQALEAKGYRVQLKSDIGSSEIVHEALTGGGLDMYPEYVGVLLSEIADQTMRPRGARAAYRKAKEFEEQRGFTLLAMTPFSDSNALAVTPRMARRHGLKTIADLASLPGGEATIGAPPEFRTRYEGLIGLRELYRLDGVTVQALQIGNQYDALDSGEVDAAAVFTTDGNLAGRDYAVLDDPRGVFAEQHVAPVISREVLATHGSGLQAAIDAVSRRLTTRAMRSMNAAVDLEGERPAAVAERFLRAEKLL